MSRQLDRLFDLWTAPPDERADPVAAFTAVYTDPVMINGAPVPVVDVVATPGKLAVALRQIGRHVGLWHTPLGVVAPTGRQVAGVGIDILTLTDGRISRIWVLADELQRLLALDAVRLATP